MKILKNICFAFSGIMLFIAYITIKLIEAEVITQTIAIIMIVISLIFAFISTVGGAYFKAAIDYYNNYD